MSGKKQHHIPRALQRGFLADEKNEKVYVFRRNGGHFPASIGDVAAQRYFYSDLSRDGSKTLDDRITNYEDRLGALLIKLRSVSIGDAVEPAIAAEVIAHLTPRSANMRRILTSGMEQLLTAAATAFSDEDTVVRMVGLDEPEPGDVWNENITRVLDNEPRAKAVLESLTVPRVVLDRYIFMAAREHIIGSYDAQSSGVLKAFETLLDGLEEMVRDGHNKALSEGMVSEVRRSALEGLEWHIRAAPPEGAILPDCVALGIDGDAFLPLMMSKAAQVSAVVMPLTSQKLLVGIQPGSGEPNLSHFNIDAAACSDELFIAASDAGKFGELHTNMGVRWVGEIDSFVEGVLRATFPTAPFGGDQVRDQAALEPINYEMAFHNLAPELDVVTLREKAQAIVAQLNSIVNLQSLDGITFTGSYQDTLITIQRGFDVNATCEGLPDHIAQGASTVLVLRDGSPKLRIVLNSAFALALTGQDQQNFEVALHLLVAGLFQADTLFRLEKAVPGFLLQPVSLSDHGGLLHCVVRKALRAYRYASGSAKFGAEELVEQEFTNYVIGSFDNAYAILAAMKREHAANPNFPKLFSVSFQMASEMLISVARLIGHRHGRGSASLPPITTQLGSAMASRHLSNWAEVFGRDLQRFWQKDTWTQGELCSFNIHVERVLWASGIMLWHDPVSGTMIKASDQ